MLSSQAFYHNMEDRSSSNEFWSNHRINIAWIVSNLGENLMHIKANLSNFGTSLWNVLNKIKCIWILLSICGNYQTHRRDMEYWHISATKVGKAHRKKTLVLGRIKKFCHSNYISNASPAILRNTVTFAQSSFPQLLFIVASSSSTYESIHDTLKQVWPSSLNAQP